MSLFFAIRQRSKDLKHLILGKRATRSTWLAKIYFGWLFLTQKIWIKFKQNQYSLETKLPEGAIDASLNNINIVEAIIITEWFNGEQ